MRAPLRASRLGVVIAVLALLGVSTLCGAPPDPAEPTEREQLTVGGFTILFHEKDAAAARAMLAAAVSRTPALLSEAGLDSLGRVTIYVAATDGEFDSLTSNGVPDWGVGCAFPSRRTVVLRSPSTVRYPLQMEDVIVHEIAHVAIGRILGDIRVPRWFHEGLAMTLAGEWRLPGSTRTSGAASARGAPALGSLSSGFPADPNAAMLAYNASFYAVRQLLESTSSRRISELLRDIRGAGDYESYLLSYHGTTPEGLEKQLSASFEKRFGWAVLLGRWYVLFGALALLLIVGGTLRIMRRRRQVLEWEREESAGVSRRPRTGKPDGRWQ